MDLNLAMLAVMERADLVRVSEYDFQVAICQYAKDCGWKYQYFRKTATQGKNGKWSAIGPAGWPDLFLARGDRALAAELKSMTGTTSPEQRQWLAALKQAGVETALWKPDDARTAMEVLE